MFIGAFGLTRKCAIPAYLVGETCGLPRANAVRPYGKERRFYISNSPTNQNSIKLHISVLYKTCLAKYLVKGKGEKCGENKANEHKSYPVENSYVCGISV